MGRQSILYAAFRPQLPAPTLATASGGTLTAGSIWLSIIPMNRVGLGQPSTLQQVTVTSGQKIQVTLPAKASGEEIHRIIIAGATSNSAAALFPLCWWRGVSWSAIGGGYYSEITNTLPATVELTAPGHLTIGGTVANPAALATFTGMLDGQLRWVTSLAQYFYYDAASLLTANGTTVLASSGAGKWLPWFFPETFGVGTITDLTAERGAWRDLRSLTDADILFPPPAYAMDGSVGPSVCYWIANGTTETGTDIEAGQRVSLEISQNGLPKSQLFDRRVVGTINGIARLSDGSLSTAGISTAQADHVYGAPLYTLEQNLLPGRALSLKVALRFKQADLDGYLQASPVEIKPAFQPQAGSYLTGYRLWGDVIYALGNKRRVYPLAGANVRVGSGAGLVQRFEFELKPQIDLALGGTSLSDFKITVNSNGDMFLRGTAANDSTEVTRAIVTMATGRSNASANSAYVAATLNQALQITVPYPSAIRSDLGDVLAGTTIASGLCELNAPFVVFYVQRQSDGQIREFTSNAVLAGSSQIFTITSFTAGTVIGSIPAPVGGNLGFWASDTAPTVAISASAGTLAADSYRVAWAFRYTGSTATAISHSTSAGCVAEMTGTVADLFQQIATLQATVTGFQNGSASIDVLNAIVEGITTLKGNVEARGAMNLWADLLTLNSDAAGAGADWTYAIQRPTTGMTANQIFRLPAGNGVADQAVVGNGAGVTSYASVLRPVVYALTYNAASSINWFTLLANKYLKEIEVQITQSWNGTNPGLSIGPATNSTKYLVSTDIDLKATGATRFVYRNVNLPPVTDEAIVISYNQSTATQGSANIMAHFWN